MLVSVTAPFLVLKAVTPEAPTDTNCVVTPVNRPLASTVTTGKYVVLP